MRVWTLKFDQLGYIAILTVKQKLKSKENSNNNSKNVYDCKHSQLRTYFPEILEEKCARIKLYGFEYSVIAVFWIIYLCLYLLLDKLLMINVITFNLKHEITHT